MTGRQEDASAQATPAVDLLREPVEGSIGREPDACRWPGGNAAGPHHGHPVTRALTLGPTDEVKEVTLAYRSSGRFRSQPSSVFGTAAERTTVRTRYS